jgi:hypothetical protein
MATDDEQKSEEKKSFRDVKEKMGGSLAGFRQYLTLRFAESFHLQRELHERPQTLPIKSSKWLWKETFKVLRADRNLWLGLGVLYLVIYAYLAAGTPSVNFAAARSTLDDPSAHVGGFIQIFSLTGSALSSSVQTNATNGPFYATFLTLIFALALVWAVRYVSAGKTVRIRDALYNGPTAFVSTIMLLLVMFAQVLPMTFGIYLYLAAKDAQIFSGGIVAMLMFLVLVMLSALSIYWICNTLLALVAVTIPGMYPGAALKATKELVAYRRFHVFLRILGYVVVVGLLWLVLLSIMVSLSFTVGFTTFMVNILRSFTLVTAIIYLYKLYRSLVDEQPETEQTAS